MESGSLSRFVHEESGEGGARCDPPIEMSETPRPLSLIWPSLATLVVIGFGAVTAGLWYPGLLILASPGAQGNLPATAFAFYSMAGPVAAALAVLTGWVRIVMGKRFSGLKWMIAIPIIWLVGLFGWLAVANAFCEGQFSCGA